MRSKIWDKITYQFPNFNGTTVEVWKWVSNFVPHFIMDVITYPITSHWYLGWHIPEEIGQYHYWCYPGSLQQQWYLLCMIRRSWGLIQYKNASHTRTGIPIIKMRWLWVSLFESFYTDKMPSLYCICPLVSYQNTFYRAAPSQCQNIMQIYLYMPWNINSESISGEFFIHCQVINDDGNVYQIIFTRFPPNMFYTIPVQVYVSILFIDLHHRNAKTLCKCILIFPEIWIQNSEVKDFYSTVKSSMMMVMYTK